MDRRLDSDARGEPSERDPVGGMHAGGYEPDACRVSGRALRPQYLKQVDADAEPLDQFVAAEEADDPHHAGQLRRRGNRDVEKRDHRAGNEAGEQRKGGQHPTHIIDSENRIKVFSVGCIMKVAHIF